MSNQTPSTDYFKVNRQKLDDAIEYFESEWNRTGAWDSATPVATISDENCEGSGFQTFLQVSASPLTRSSYHADEDFQRLRAARSPGAAD